MESKLPQNLYSWIDAMKVRTPMWLGGRAITRMESFILGYFAACEVNGIEEEHHPEFFKFHDFVANYFKWNESTAGWTNILLKECGSEEAALEQFFVLFDQFRATPLQ